MDKGAPYICHGILPSLKKNEIMPSAATRMQLEILIQSEVSLKNTKWYHLHVESKLWHKWSCLWNRDSHIEKRDPRSRAATQRKPRLTKTHGLQCSLQPAIQQPRHANSLNAPRQERIEKMWSMHTMEYYSATQRKETTAFAATWMDLEMILLSEVRQTVRHQHRMLPPTCGLWKKDTITSLQNRYWLTDFEKLTFSKWDRLGSGGIYTAGLDGNATKFVCDGRCTTINAIEKKKKYINNKKKKKKEKRPVDWGGGEWSESLGLADANYYTQTGETRSSCIAQETIFSIPR